MTKVALVTGGNRGIGLAITKAMLCHGYAVQILSRSQPSAELLDEMARLGEVGHTRGDVSDLSVHERFITDTVAKWGGALTCSSTMPESHPPAATISLMPP